MKYEEVQLGGRCSGNFSSVISGLRNAFCSCLVGKDFNPKCHTSLAKPSQRALEAIGDIRLKGPELKSVS